MGRARRDHHEGVPGNPRLSGPERARAQTTFDRATRVLAKIDALDVQPVRPVAGGVLLEYPGVGDVQLGGEVRGDRLGHVGGICQERPEESDGAHLHGEPEAVVLPAADVDEFAGNGVQVEVPVQLPLVGVTGVPTVAALLLGGQEPSPAGGLPARSIPATTQGWCAGTGRRSPG